MLRCKQTLIPARICPARRAPFPARNRSRSARRAPFCGQFGGKRAGSLCTVCTFLHRKNTARSETALPGFRIPFKLLTVRESVGRRRSVRLMYPTATSVPAGREPPPCDGCEPPDVDGNVGCSTGSAPDRVPAHRCPIRDGEAGDCPATPSGAADQPHRPRRRPTCAGRRCERRRAPAGNGSAAVRGSVSCVARDLSRVFARCRRRSVG